MVRLLSFIFSAFVFSCTIIEDSDITSQEELDNLKLKSIEIKEETTSGTKTSVVKLLYDSIQDFIDTSTGARILRRQRFSMPSLSSKLRLRSGTSSNTEFTITYLEGGKPYTFAIFKGDSLVERYRFRYNNYTSSGKLNKIVTFLNPVDNLPYLTQTSDTLIFDTSGELTNNGIERRSPDPAKTGTFAFEYRTDNTRYYIGKVTFKGTNYENPCQGGGCPSYGGNYHAQAVLSNGGFGQPIGVLNVTDFQRANLSIQDRNHDLAQYGCPTCIRYIDTFYFHPLLLLKDELELGDELMFIYMVDWWQPISSVESPNDEKVTFSFKYGL